MRRTDTSSGGWQREPSAIAEQCVGTRSPHVVGHDLESFAGRAGVCRAGEPLTFLGESQQERAVLLDLLGARAFEEGHAEMTDRLAVASFGFERESVAHERTRVCEPTAASSELLREVEPGPGMRQASRVELECRLFGDQPECERIGLDAAGPLGGVVEDRDARIMTAGLGQRSSEGGSGVEDAFEIVRGAGVAQVALQGLDAQFHRALVGRGAGCFGGAGTASHQPVKVRQPDKSDRSLLPQRVGRPEHRRYARPARANKE